MVNRLDWEIVRAKLYRIGKEERFKTRVEQLWVYLERKTTYKRTLQLRYGNVKMILALTRDGWRKGSAKSEAMVMQRKKTKKNEKKYYYVKMHEVVGEKPPTKILKIRVDDKGCKSELMWLGKGQKISGKEVGKIAHVFYKALRPREVFVHDDANIEFEYAGGSEADKIRKRRRKRAASKKRSRKRKKKKASKRKPKSKISGFGSKKKLKISLRVIRILSKGKAWYESMGYAPVKRSGHTFLRPYGNRTAYSQHPAQYRAAVERVRNTTIEQFSDMCRKSAQIGSRSKLETNVQEICQQLGNPRKDTTLATLCTRVLGKIRRKPKSLIAQRLLQKFNSTFLQDHEARFDCPTGKLVKYYTALGNVNLTMFFTKKKADYE